MFLLTRPKQQASSTLQVLRENGFEAINSPMLRIVHKAEQPAPADNHSAIAITSANAIPELNNLWQDRDKMIAVFTVGQATAEKLSKAGFTNIISVSDDARSLANAMIASMNATNSGAKVLNPTAEQTAFDLQNALQHTNIALTKWIAYQVEDAETFSPEAETALRQGAIKGVLLYSPRTAENFCRLLQRSGLVAPPRLFCLSDKVAQSLSPECIGNSVIAEMPNEKALIAKLY